MQTSLAKCSTVVHPNTLYLFLDLTLRFFSSWGDSEAPGEIQGLTQSCSLGFSLSWAQPWPLLAGDAAHWSPRSWSCCTLGHFPATLCQNTDDLACTFLRSKWARNHMSGDFIFFFLKQECFQATEPAAQGKQGHRQVPTEAFLTILVCLLLSKVGCWVQPEEQVLGM